MIKINLLPIRASRKKETAKQQITVFVVSIIAVGLAALAVYSLFSLQIQSTKNEISRAETEIQVLRAKIGKINNLKMLQKEVRKKLDILVSLRKGKVGPVQRLAILTDSAPDKLWLTKYSESGSSVIITGVAFNEDLIAEYMRNLEASTGYEAVELIVSEQAEMTGIKLKKFELKMQLEDIKTPVPLSVPAKTGRQ